MPEKYTDSGAMFSECRQYRYALWRRWQHGDDWMAFIGLNPSTADETQDDPTIRRVVGYAKREGYGGVVMLNMYAWRSTDPAGLMGCLDPVGPDNNIHIIEWCCKSGLVILGCGAHVSLSRYERVRDTLRIEGCGDKMRALGFTSAKFPKHPLYLRADTPLVLI